MNTIIMKIENIMKRDQDSSETFLSFLLYTLSGIYGGALKTRAFFYKTGILKSKQLPCTVISIGNITLGGTGKTPMTMKTALLVSRLGYKTAVVSRGYKGKGSKDGGIAGDGQNVLMDPDMAGDEPFMMASDLKDIPVIVGKNRFRAGIRAVETFNPDVIVLDDAFQHLKLKRDINLVLLDSRNPFGNTHLIPRGTLREHVSALIRADAFIITRSEPHQCDVDATLKPFIMGRPVFISSHVPYIYKIIKPDLSNDPIPDDCRFLKNRNAVVFSGIADNSSFHRTVQAMDCHIAGFMSFQDHHRYSKEDIENISRLAKENSADIVLTTEKDYVKITAATWPVDLVVIGIDISFQDETAFEQFIRSRLEKADKEADRR